MVWLNENVESLVPHQDLKLTLEWKKYFKMYFNVLNIFV